jgi:hypothetical protein
MKYLLKWRITSPPKDKEDWDNRLKDNKIREDEKKYGKVIFAGHQTGNYTGITIVDCSYEQLKNRLALTTWLEYSVVPLIPASEMIPLYEP